jgi:hypothetical protein
MVLLRSGRAVQKRASTESEVEPGHVSVTRSGFGRALRTWLRDRPVAKPDLTVRSIETMPPRLHSAPEELAAFIDGRLEFREWDRMTAHLATCAACRKELLAVIRLIRGEPGSKEDP